MAASDESPAMPRQRSLEGASRRGAFAAGLDAPDGERRAIDPSADPAAFDAVVVRNYDHRRRHAVRVTLADAEAGEVLDERCSLAPGQAERLRGEFDPGAYDLRVRIDGVERARTTCRLGPEPGATAVVELGNGAVSVTDGADDPMSATR